MYKHPTDDASFIKIS